MSSPRAPAGPRLPAVTGASNRYTYNVDPPTPPPRSPVTAEAYDQHRQARYAALPSSSPDEHYSGQGMNTNANANVDTDMRTRKIVWTALTFVFVTTLAILVFFQHVLPDACSRWLGVLPSDPDLAALAVLDIAPVIDGHIDLPYLIREVYANNASAVDLQSRMQGQVDIPRLREGRVGGFFWSVYVPCPSPKEEKDDFTGASWRVRDTLEQIDIAKLLIAKYPKVRMTVVNPLRMVFQLALSSEDIQSAVVAGKIASLLGVEGGHQLGNSIAVLRQYYELGVRYVTLTHVCHNAFADSCGLSSGIFPHHGGLSPFGHSLVREMNRLGVLVDLSHTSDATAEQALNYSRAPVIWSHSSARTIRNHRRNVPDSILRLIGTNDGQKDAVVMVNFAADFIAAPGEADIKAVADHIEHIAKVAGKQHVGLGSDFDGIGEAPRGLEDVSKYPSLIAELYERGWNKYDLVGLTGANLLRVLEGAERVAMKMQAEGASPSYEIYDRRTDIPIPPFGRGV